ncbi:DsbA family protein [Sphingomonas lutea]|uniref:DsbA family protein n=1 Tax=Sphingomonas lutea TaxID=1045317 RepID=A0A7G9SH70_9SPHN|nr:DsbA family protein [Sphingomonas lutea]
MDETKAAPPPGGKLGAAIAGGVIGALLVAAALIFIAPQFLSSRIVREGLLSEPQILSDAADALRDQQFAPVINAQRAAIETPFASSWKGASKPDVTIVEFYDYACPYCKASNPHVDRLIAEDKGLRIVYRELPILGPNSLTAARLALTASKQGRFMQFHDALWAAGRPSPRPWPGPRKPRASVRWRRKTRRSRPSCARISRSPANSARPAPRCSSSATA